jgi:hypothetical protein
MMFAPVASGISPIISSYAVKLLIDLFTQNTHISLEQSFYPILIFIASQSIVDIAWRAHNFAQLKSIAYVLQDLMDKVCKHCFNLSYDFYQNNFSGSVVAKIKGIGDNYFKIHEGLEYWLTKPLFITLFSKFFLILSRRRPVCSTETRMRQELR